jgi:hypothetical protein
MQPNRPREIRKFVQQQFAEISPDLDRIDQETLLIRNGQYCGHRYQNDRLTAVWFLEENQLKVYDEAGHVLRVVSPTVLVASRSDAA